MIAENRCYDVLTNLSPSYLIVDNFAYQEKENENEQGRNF